MRSLPLIYRELLISSRRPSTYRQRIFVGAMASISLVLFAVFTPSLSSQSGQVLFGAMSWAFFVFCILQGLRETADSLAQERREGTLGLLFLTDLRGYDVVLGKLAAATVKSFAALLAMLPAIVLPLWLGGVTGEECWRVAVALGAALLLSMTAGLWISSISRNAFLALLSGFLLVTTIMLLPALCIGSGRSLPLWTAGPLEMLDGTLKSQTTARSGAFWPATLYSAILCGLFFWLSGRALSRTSLAEPVQNTSGWWQRLSRPTIGLRESWGGTPSDDPAAWLGERTLPGRKMLWILVGTAALVCFLLGAIGTKSMFVLFPIQIAFGLLIKLWIAVLSVQPFNSARRNGAFELLLCTPLSPASLVRGQMNALRAYFFAPGFVSAFGLTLANALGTVLFHPNITTKIELIPGMVFGLMWFLVFLLDLHALSLAGLWFGLTEAQLPQAVAKTVFRILVLPWITLIVPILGALGIFFWPFIWMAWAETKLNKRFYQEAANPFSTDIGLADCSS